VTDRPFRFSIVVPTYQRRDVLLGTVRALAQLETPWPVELVVVVDGSTDGSADAVRAEPVPFPMTVLEHPNRGLSATRNRGASAARGEVLLFLDDDMTADPRLLVEHDAALRAGADATVGHIPLSPDSPRNLLTAGVERWVRLRHERLSRTGGRLALGDLICGQMAVRAEVFAANGGFDEDFNRGGSFGAEDTDFLHRLLRSGAEVRYAPGAIAWQKYVVTPDQYLRQWKQAGYADAVLTRKHPDLGPTLAEQHGAGSPSGRVLRRLAPKVPARVARSLAAPVLARARRGGTDLATRWAFTRVRDAAYWRGLAELGGYAEAGPPVVLAYHAIENVDDDVIGPWCVAPADFVAQIDALTDSGVHWIGVRELLGWLDGAPLPARAALLTFDDAYADLLDNAAPVLEERGIPALVLVVGEQLGGWNEWDARRGAAKLPLLDVAQLQELARRGWEIGAHSASHAHLTQLSSADLAHEFSQPLQALAEAGLPVQPVVAYPHGEHTARVRAAARRAGYAAAFALEGRRPSTSSRGRFALPRVEVRRDTTTEALVATVVDPPRYPLREVERELRGAVRTLLLAAGRNSARR
jgi:GT2 family glycosyltransferase/peptidoglycan/xylan/chitin deacetylase (PgdA/CDA1 family)